MGFLRSWLAVIMRPDEVVRAQADELEELRDQVVNQAAAIIRLKGHVHEQESLLNVAAAAGAVASDWGDRSLAPCEQRMLVALHELDMARLGLRP